MAAGEGGGVGVGRGGGDDGAGGGGGDRGGVGAAGVVEDWLEEGVDAVLVGEVDRPVERDPARGTRRESATADLGASHARAYQVPWYRP